MRHQALLLLLALVGKIAAKETSTVTSSDEATHTDETTNTDDATNTDDTESSTVTAAVTQSVLIVTIAVVPLTTTFKPPASCTQGRLSQLASPGYEIWINEPEPAYGEKVTDCYPSQYIGRYTSLANESSSIAPLMSPLVCPEGWVTAKQWTNAYIACCASGYNLAPPSVTSDSDRPAYGGTCYSNFKSGQTATVTAYDNENVTATVKWIASSSADQAYGHVIDGFALDLLATATSTTTSSETASETASETPSQAASTEDSSSITGGAIAGIVIGCLLGVGAAAFAAFWFYRRRRRQQPQQTGHIGELDGDPPIQEFEGSNVTATSSPTASSTVSKPTFYTGTMPPYRGGDEPPIDRDSYSGISPLTPEAKVLKDSRLMHAELDAGWKGY
ncbi:hypothetical protein G7Z17_g1250 [Cylindrodendrum hubeiense]|uniref:Uncharacterized protein n=1 Tax=Cylindrodendrum hubeiense TaxID=595255 RepID=A0A9P5HJV3_9HYPO|nr:hypothetical protein G7Z17_g1250 [Cylindrodendrum hubeiense]